MEKTIFEKLENSTAVTHLLNKDGHFVVQDALSLSLLVTSAFNKKPQKMCVVASNLYNAQQIYEQMVSLIGEDNVLFFPQDEVLRVDIEAFSKEMLIQRLYVLEKILENKNVIVVCHVASVTRYLPEVELFKSNILELKVGQTIEINKIVNKLISQNFTRVNKIDGSLQFALRGDILDIYPINYDNPIRIEFFDDEIESIRSFEISDQLSKGNVDSVKIFPANDLLINEGFSDKLDIVLKKELLKCKEKLSSDLYCELENKISKDLINIKENGFNENYYKYYSLIVEKKINIMDYLKPDTTIIYDYPKCLDSYEFLINQTYSYYSELFKIGKSLLYYDFFDNFVDAIQHSKTIINTYASPFSKDDVELPIRAIPQIASNIFHSFELIDEFINEGKKVIACFNNTQFDSYKEYLDDYQKEYKIINPNQVPNSDFAITHFPLTEGFELINENLVYLSAREIFGAKQHVSKFLSRYKKAKVIKSYEELEKGDYVVHEECGIGIFEEIVTLEVQGNHKDFIKIQYADKGVLYVPLEQFRLVRKFVSKEGAVPKLNKIGGKEWEKTKQRIKNKVNDLADRLLKLYSERSNTAGFAFKPDDEFQNAFEKAFPYVLTDDQIKAVEEIKQDMESPHPMDRLLCGDVGFGKTEVAFRAAFKAILSGTQVALLCPTTLLARQHYERAIERFSLFGVNIALFSRFVPESIQKRQIEEIKEGKIHFIIGTHRLLSKDILIPNLKLLIIDEEQRFGVEHKERIKELAKNIDCLTLTATPIPRTLQMSLVGMRSLSQLQSAPMNRMPIQTYVVPYQDSVVKEAIERELARKGQVFYLHNLTSSIAHTARKLQSMVKNARIDFVHGKMDKDEIEDVMSRFYNNEIDILICTSIIETGLDIANANTIIIESADRFGLSQLYQIKGRVGRSNRVAYAYLMFDEQKELNDIARKRLKALKDFTELGSGFKIAQRDLSIRGAGDILGPQQAGFIDTVGIDMYIKLLNEVIKEKQGFSVETKQITVSNINVDGYIPKGYANDGDKLELYQEIQNINSIPSLEMFKNKMMDIYGRLPQEVEILIRKRKLDILGSSPNISSMKEEMGAVVIILSEELSQKNRIGITLFEKLGKLADHINASIVNHQIKLKLKKNEQFLMELEKVLIIINEITM
ncbi:MAG: transcription-repair coupling factor [Bacillales bacterium]|nr:transcription-repair coupling factor [Bacillales bacterium]